MTEYIIYKKEPCPCSAPVQEGVAVYDIAWGDPCIRCKGTRYILTEVNLLDVLAKVRWTHDNLNYAYRVGESFGMDNARMWIDGEDKMRIEE